LARDRRKTHDVLLRRRRRREEGCTHLIADSDFEAIDAGPLENARYVEAYAILVIRPGHTLGLGTNIAMKLMRR
jgi:predicted dinucleotide-binding enzyme